MAGRRTNLALMMLLAVAVATGALAWEEPGSRRRPRGRRRRRLSVAFGGLLRWSEARGAERRLTGSHETGSFDPARMPVAQWLDDDVPVIDLATWRLAITSPGAPARSLTSGGGSLSMARRRCCSRRAWQATRSRPVTGSPRAWWPRGGGGSVG